MISLPIDAVLSEISGALEKGSGLVLEAPPGAGKTTRVPRALLDRGFAERGEILVLEPRRIAARMAARRVAEELGEAPGRRVGFSTRFESAGSAETRVRFVTEGVLTRRLLADPRLAGVSVVVLDEVHERHLASDLALALLRRLQRGPRPDLKIVAMSATLEAGPLAAFLEAPVVRAEGRAFEVEIEHAPREAERSLELAVAAAIRAAVRAEASGDVLVFLPGSAEIRRAMQAAAPVARDHDLLLLPLHGSLSPAEQDRAVRPAERRKVILATNVAETSVTIDGVTTVIDSGLARIASHAPWSGLPTLKVTPVSRSSAIQRAGRAGRTRPGRCVRLYSKGDFLARPEHEAPEIARADLSEALLELAAHGEGAAAGGGVDVGAFPFFEAPPASGIEAALELLERLGALEREGARARLTDTGRRMLRFPLHPRLARMLVECERRGIAVEGAAIAAIAGERGLLARSAPVRSGHSADLLAWLDAYDEAKARRLSPEACRAAGVDERSAAAAEKVEKQLARLVDRRLAPPPTSPEAFEQAALASILCAFPDRVGRVRRPANATGRRGREVVFASGDSAALAEESALGETAFAVAVDAEERSEGRSRRALVRSASAVSVELLLECFFDRVVDESVVVWNASAERAELSRRLRYEGLVLEESPGPRGPDPRLSAELRTRALTAGPRAFLGDFDALAVRARLAFAREHFPEAPLPSLEPEGLSALLGSACEGLSSFAELREAFPSLLRSALSGPALSELEAIAPSQLTLPGGRRLRIEYPEGAPPFAASRMQDFFGMTETPRLARGRVPLVLHLLAPNQRAVQVTTDLAGFWSKHYPSLAKELRRKYPKHSFPDDPRTASPPPPRRPTR